MNQKQTLSTKANRLTSLDALRGFNMFWIIGGEEIADALRHLSFPGAGLIAAQLNHALWNGFTFYDLIYPMFIFVVGISIAFSIESRRKKGESSLRILQHILIRTGLLFLLGVYMSNSGYFWRGIWTNIRLMGVLQRIALCYCGASILALFANPRRQIITVICILAGYWFLLRFIPVPGVGMANWDQPQANLANYLDSRLLPGRLYYGAWDPEGLLSTFPALATCLLGLITGYWLKNEQRVNDRLFTKTDKSLFLAMAGAVLLVLGILWGLDFPINKKIWTSSYVLVAGGLSAVFMAFFYWFIDLRGHKKWAFPFVVIGLNSIFIYVAVNIVPFGAMANWLIGDRIFTWLGEGRDLFQAVLTLIIEWMALYIMYKRKIFLRL